MTEQGWAHRVRIKQRVRDTKGGALAADLVRWSRLWWFHQHGYQPWDRAFVHYRLARRGAFARWPLHGNVSDLLAEGRLEVGRGVLLASQVLITAQAPGRVVIGEETFIGIGTHISATELVEIGARCQVANGCFISDNDHVVDDPTVSIHAQGLRSKGPTRIGDDVWIGANAVVTSGVTIGRHCVIGANSVVTRDVPPGTLAAGVPARPVKTLPMRPSLAA